MDYYKTPFVMSFHLLGILTSVCFSFGCKAPEPLDSQLTLIRALPAVLNESSGLVSLGDGWYVGTNDSGNPAELHVFNIEDKTINRTVKINNASNNDWEELAADDQYVYIGNTGNNNGTRKNLGIYRINKAELRLKDVVDAQSISYSYPEQLSFEKSGKHNFDCEALAVAGDSLYLFTKNRGDLKTNMYSLPKTPGTYTAKQLGQFNAQGLVTGAHVRNTRNGNELVLIGYTEKKQGYHPFLIFFTDVTGIQFFDGKSHRLTFEGRMQTESVMFHDDQYVYITNEGEHGDQANMYSVRIPE